MSTTTIKLPIKRNVDAKRYITFLTQRLIQGSLTEEQGALIIQRARPQWKLNDCRFHFRRHLWFAHHRSGYTIEEKEGKFHITGRKTSSNGK